jgi:hypothetical protein
VNAGQIGSDYAQSDHGNIPQMFGDLNGTICDAFGNVKDECVTP